jgi:hypothetical protein
VRSSNNLDDDNRDDGHDDYDDDGVLILFKYFISCDCYTGSY